MQITKDDYNSENKYIGEDRAKQNQTHSNSLSSKLPRFDEELYA